jgi:hypothetical protein
MFLALYWAAFLKHLPPLDFRLSPFPPLERDYSFLHTPDPFASNDSAVVHLRSATVLFEREGEK